jgi:hypothetical protein
MASLSVATGRCTSANKTDPPFPPATRASSRAQQSHRLRKTRRAHKTKEGSKLTAPPPPARTPSKATETPKAKAKETRFHGQSALPPPLLLSLPPTLSLFRYTPHHSRAGTWVQRVRGAGSCRRSTAAEVGAPAARRASTRPRPCRRSSSVRSWGS